MQKGFLSLKSEFYLKKCKQIPTRFLKKLFLIQESLTKFGKAFRGFVEKTGVLAPKMS